MGWEIGVSEIEPLAFFPACLEDEVSTISSSKDKYLLGGGDGTLERIRQRTGIEIEKRLQVCGGVVQKDNQPRWKAWSGMEDLWHQKR